MNIELRMAHTGVRPKHHQGVIFDELKLTDLAFSESNCGKGGMSGRADTIDRVQNGAVDVDCHPC